MVGKSWRNSNFFNVVEKTFSNLEDIFYGHVIKARQKSLSSVIAPYIMKSAVPTTPESIGSGSSTD